MKKKNTKKQEMMKIWTKVTIVLALVILIVIIYSNYQSNVGKAVDFSCQPSFPEIVDLVTEESIVFTCLPEDPVTITFNSSISPYESGEIYNITLTKREDLTYNVEVKKGTIVKAIEILDTNHGEDRTFIHLNMDAVPDLGLFYLNGQIIIKNLHFVDPDTSTIVLLNGSGVEYSSIIRLAEDEVFKARINATSTSAPELSAEIDGIAFELINYTTVAVENYSTAIINFTSSISDAYVLDIKAAVQEQETHAYYTLAVGNVVYALRESGYPEMTVTLGENGIDKFSVTFVNIQDLQPFALPCNLTDPDIDDFFPAGLVERIYTYDSSAGGGVNLWTSLVDAADDFEEFKPFGGYFIKLNKTLASDANTTIEAACEVQELKQAPPGMGLYSSELLETGWNLISLPGTIPKRLTEFTNNADFVIYGCSQGYSCDDDPIPNDSLLDPGKPYWVKAEHSIPIIYALK